MVSEGYIGTARNIWNWNKLDLIDNQVGDKQTFWGYKKDDKKRAESGRALHFSSLCVPNKADVFRLEAKFLAG